MKMTVAGLMVLALTAACSLGESAGSTTVPPSGPGESTTTAAPSLATAAPTTTSTAAPTTTLLEGRWAEVPLVIGWAGSALGWWDGSRWVGVDAATVLPIEGGEDYQVALRGLDIVKIEGEGQGAVCDISDEFSLPAVELSDPDMLTLYLESDPALRGVINGVAISAPWDIAPRPVAPAEWSADLEAHAIGLLAERGFVTDAVVVKDVLDADFDGDGEPETVAVVEDTRVDFGADAESIESGVYSLVFVVVPADDAVYVIEESVVPPGEWGYPASFAIPAVVDLNGDGVLELVLDAGAWEAGWQSVYEFTDTGFIERLTSGCGV